MEGPHFSSEVEVSAAAETWLAGQYFQFLFLEWFVKVKQRAKTFIELRVSMLNKTQV
jgi:hypothetical protein